MVEIFAGGDSFTGANVKVYGPSGLIAEFDGPTEAGVKTWWVFDLNGDNDEISEVNTLDQSP
ncbi:MAG: hypothetical protein AAF490_29500 [Chloroflexota bacterium]